MKSTFKSKLIIPALIVTFIIIIDQLSKLYVITLLEPRVEREIVALSFFKIVYVWNSGISLGMFGSFKHSNNLFLVLSLSITVFIGYLLLQARSKLELLSYSLIIGGAVGNIIDRAKYGKVFDFICLHIDQYYWPAFNVADSAISMGAAVFVLNLIYYSRR